MSVYTKKGDKGKTKIFSKKTGKLTSVAKDSCHIKTIGAIDELNSYLGVVNVELRSDKIKRIQGNLFTVNAIIAGAKLDFKDFEVKDLEKDIDKWEGELPVQTGFIYYSGSKTSTHLFYARALARRAERELTEFSKKQLIPDEIRKYINRLSDYLFIMARNENFKRKIKEEYWKTAA